MKKQHPGKITFIIKEGDIASNLPNSVPKSTIKVENMEQVFDEKRVEINEPVGDMVSKKMKIAKKKKNFKRKSEFKRN